MPFKQANCRGCNAPIFFARTPKGANVPLDYEPVDVWPTLRGEAPVRVLGWEVRQPAGDNPPAASSLGYMTLLEAPEDGSRKVYRSHWETCPAREQFRR